MNVYLALQDITVPLVPLITLIRYAPVDITVQKRLNILCNFLVFHLPLIHRQVHPTSPLVSLVPLAAIVVQLDYQL